MDYDAYLGEVAQPLDSLDFKHFQTLPDSSRVPVTRKRKNGALADVEEHGPH